MKVLELFAGTRSIGKAFEERGHEVYSVEWDKSFDDIDLYKDIGQLTVQEILDNFGHPDVVWMSPDCFPAGNLVWTDKGYKNIEDVRCNDYVLTHKGNYEKVYRTVKKNTYKFVNLKISGCEEFQATLNHKFYVRKKRSYSTHENGIPVRKSWLEKPEWVEAENLSTEYKVGIPINKNSIIPNWQGCVKETRNKYGLTNSYIVNDLGKYMSNEDFWWLIGRYLGDGCLSKEKYLVDICCSYDEIQEIKQVVDRLNIKYTTREKESTFSFLFSSKELCEFLDQMVGHGSLNKFISIDVLNLPINLLQSFLNGYISADGHLYEKDVKNPYYSMNTVSKKLAYGLQQCILKAFNRYCSMIIRDNQNDIIQGRKVNTHRAYCLSFYKNETNRFQYKIEDGMAWVNIKNVEIVNDKQKSIYTLSVENDESYTVNNIAVHNCSSFSVAGISHHRRKNKETGNLDPISDYAKFCDEVDQHCLELVKQLNPTYWFIENPRGGLRSMSWMQGLPRYTVTYCQYMLDKPVNEHRMKPTDIWTNHPNPKFKPPCKNGDPCHVSAPRGSRTGTQGIKGAKLRSVIPQELCRHIVDICEEGIDD